MANTFFGLNIGTLGIHASNVSINITANNIANEYTEGYARQTAVQKATTPLRVYQKYGMIGSGVEVTEIKRIRNAYYDVKYQENQSRYGENNTLYYHMLKIEDQFNEAKVDGFTEEFDNVYDAIEELSKDASNYTTRKNYLNYLQSFLEYLQEIKTDLTIHQEDVNAEINDNVSMINSYAQEISLLNKQINVIEMTGANANELRDEREVLLDKLSEIVEIEAYEIPYANGKSEFVVKVSDAVLVDNYNYYTLKTVSREEFADSDDAVGLYEVQWSYGTKFNPTTDDGGVLKALMLIRDGNNGEIEMNEDGTAPLSRHTEPIDYKGIPYYIDQVNEMLATFTEAINSVHAKGEDLYGKSAADYGDDYEPVIVQTASGKYVVNDAVKEDLNLIATSYQYEDGASQNDLVEELRNTKNTSIYNGGTASEFLQAIVTEAAVDTRKTKSLMENYQNMQTTIDNQRLSVMGVDRDEEAMNLVKFQEAYNLNSKVISIMAEIYDRLILQTGV